VINVPRVKQKNRKKLIFYVGSIKKFDKKGTEGIIRVETRDIDLRFIRVFGDIL